MSLQIKQIYTISKILYIISERYTDVNYTSDGKRETFIDQFKQKPIDNDIKSFSTAFKNLNDYTELNQLLSKFPALNNEIKETAISVAQNTNSMSEFDSVCSRVTSSTSQFTATLKNIATNAGAVLAINLIIQTVSLAWDSLNVTVEEQEAKVNNLQAAYQNLSSEYEQLSGKQDLTEAERNRLSYLHRFTADRQGIRRRLFRRHCY